MNNKIIPIILCGGAGKRLWPLSRKNHPKPFLKFLNPNSFLQDTITRTLSCDGCLAENLTFVTTQDLKPKVETEIKETHSDALYHVLGEPSAKNTGVAIAFAGGYASRTFGEESILWFIPSDHIIDDVPTLNVSLNQAKNAAQEGYITTFGIHPDYAETGYGYIEKGSALPCGGFKIEHFHEKPDEKTAETYIEKGYLWNSGMFIVQAKALKNGFSKIASDYMPIWEGQQDAYTDITPAPFDTLIMEKTDMAAVIDCNPGWADIGTWKNLARHRFPARQNNKA